MVLHLPRGVWCSVGHGGAPHPLAYLANAESAADLHCYGASGIGD